MDFMTVRLRIFATIWMTVSALAIAGCQSDKLGALDVSDDPGQPPAEEQVLESDLRKFCPEVRLREGTTYFSTYQGNATDDPTKLIYQASISDVTRACRYDGGVVTVTVAVAGRIVSGPAGKTGTITMPIRVAALRGGEVLYSKLHKFPVTVADTIGATQFIFKDPEVVLPAGIDSSVVLFAGYDEGSE